MVKDLFSSHSDLYARFRPAYPPELFSYILSFVKEKKLAHDCGTGNGQAAAVLADHFEKVFATDISAQQIGVAQKRANIEYIISPAEKTSFGDNTFDLITVAQAYHWLDWNQFHHEAARTAKNNGVVAIWMYGNIITGEKKINEVITDFYKHTVGPYWDSARKHVDANYETVTFNFDALPSKPFMIELQWNFDHLIGYIGTWSAVTEYRKTTGNDPMHSLVEELIKSWSGADIHITFPVHLRIGRVIK